MLALVYRPPHLVKDFINEFTAFMGDCITKYNNILLLGDFYIHVCCQSKPLEIEFLSLIDSFNMVQLVKDPTHTHGHTLDLVLSHGFSITDVQVFDTLLLDHMPVLFTLPFSQLSSSITPTVQLTRSFSSHFCDDFTNTFNKVCLSLSLESFLPDLDAEQHLSLFNTACSEVLNTTAPLKPKKSKPKTEPWLSDNIRSLRQACRRAERKWKKDKLQISPFITKALEKTVLIQLQSFLRANHIFETFQSGFKPLHSTESALLRVLNDTLLATDSGDHVILILLDLTSAFDTVDHGTLLSRLEYFVGIQGTVLSWFKSYLTNRTFSVRLIFLHCLLNLPVECPRVLFSHPFFSLCIYFLWALFSESMVYHFIAMRMIPTFFCLSNEINMLLWNLFLHAWMK